MPDRDETEEERRARRLAKKEKKRAREAAMAAMPSGYSNEANPWQDANLTDRFSWGKKAERDVARSGGKQAGETAEKKRRVELQRELEKVKRSREEREREKEAWEEEKVMLEREREQMAFTENEKREEEFQHKQTQMRTHIRVAEGRARPLDLLSESLLLLSGDADEVSREAVELPLEAPSAIFYALRPHELREMHAEIGHRAASDPANADFWRSMHLLAERAMSGEGGGSALHAEVHADVETMLGGKSIAELRKLLVESSSVVVAAAAAAAVTGPPGGVL